MANGKKAGPVAKAAGPKAGKPLTAAEMAALDLKEARGGRMAQDEKRPVPPQFLKKGSKK